MKQFKRTLESYKIKHNGLTPCEVKAKRFRDMVTTTLQKRANTVNSLWAKAGILTRIKPFYVGELRVVKSEFKYEEIK